MAALAILIISLLVVLIAIIALVSAIRRKRRLWIWYLVYVTGWAFAITGIILYVLSTTSTDSTQPPSELTTRDASELVLTIDDFKAGWIRSESRAVIEEGAQSAYYVYFHEGAGETCCSPVVQNTVAVYPNINLAKIMYLAQKPTNISLEHPEIGDECFLNILFPENKILVFRKSNVVVWVQLQQDEFGNAEHYAKIIEQRLAE